MARKASVVIEKDEYGFYAWCPELKGCQSQGDSLEEAMTNIRFERQSSFTSKRFQATSAMAFSAVRF